MKKLLFAGFAVGALVAPAFAADMPVPVAPVTTWTGMYVGANGGYFEGANNAVNVVGLPNPCNSGALGCILAPNYSNTSGLAATFNTPVKQKGVLYGGQIGYNSQVATTIVVGVEADLQGVSRNNDSVTLGSVTPNVNFPASYLYVGLGTSSVNFNLISPLNQQNFSSATVVSSTRFSENVARAGLNYHF